MLLCRLFRCAYTAKELDSRGDIVCPQTGGVVVAVGEGASDDLFDEPRVKVDTGSEEGATAPGAAWRRGRRGHSDEVGQWLQRRISRRRGWVVWVVPGWWFGGYVLRRKEDGGQGVHAGRGLLCPLSSRCRRPTLLSNPHPPPSISSPRALLSLLPLCPTRTSQPLLPRHLANARPWRGSAADPRPIA